jgi:Amt family ammonium transporter
MLPRLAVVVLVSAVMFITAAAETCPYNNAQFDNGTCMPCGGLQYPEGDHCVNYKSKKAKLAGDFAATLDTGNTAWMLASSALVMIMTPALGFFYAGLAGEENAINTMMMSIVSITIVTLSWVLFGYSFAFGPGNGRFGSTDYVAMHNLGELISPAYGVNVPQVIYVAFQCMFAQITPALISGAIVGRMNFFAYCIYIFVWSLVVYNCLAQWMWSFTIDDNGVLIPNGWMNSMGAIDFAGGTVIHISSGFSALAAALVVGKRKQMSQVKPHNLPLVMQGATLLWFGWFGFNAGSAGAANGVACIAFLNTHVATCACVFAWLALETVHKKQQTAVGAATAMVVGLVAITPACGFVTPMASIAIGIVAAVVVYGSVFLKARFLQVDDTLDAFCCHGLGGVVGTFMTGLFAKKSINGVDGAFYGRGILLGYQMLAIVVSASFSFAASGAMLLILKHTVGIRASDEDQEQGMDTAHGETAYDMQPKPVSPATAIPKSWSQTAMSGTEPMSDPSQTQNGNNNAQ